MSLIKDLIERIANIMPSTLVAFLTVWEIYLITTKNWSIKYTTVGLFYGYLVFFIYSFHSHMSVWIEYRL